MPTAIALAKLYEKALLQILKVTPGSQAKKLLGIIGEGNLQANSDIPESLRNRYFDTVNDLPSGNDNADFNTSPKIVNEVYNQSQTIYQTNYSILVTNKLPSRPSSLLPIKEGIEGNGQTPTAISIGAPISIAQTLENQKFGSLLYNPFSSEKLKIRQVSNVSAVDKLAKLNQAGIENFAKYLAKEETANVLDAVCIFSPNVLRGLSGETGVLFGRDTIKFLLSNFSTRSVNALIGVTSSITSGYEIEQYEPEFVEDTENIEGISMQSSPNSSIDKIYQILGGDSWQETEDGNLKMVVKPEQLLETVGNVLYNENSATLSDLTVTNLLELITAFCTVDYFRSGHHRLPATVLTSLRNTEAGNVPQQIYDAMSYQEWVVRQIDDLVGEFPLNLKFLTQDDEGKEIEKSISLENISETIAEIFPILVNTAEDSDTAINIGMKTLVEAMQAKNSAVSTFDYAVANAEYLGYKGNETEREIDLTFSPGAKSLREALKPSKKKIIGWQNEEKSTLIEAINRTLIASEIVKGALLHPYNPGDKITGDAIREDQEAKQETNEAAWEEFKQRVNNPTGRYSVSKPKARIKDLTVDNPASEA